MMLCVSARTGRSGSYSVRFTDTFYPTIYSTGAVTIAALKAALTRVVEVKTANAPHFGAGITSLGGIRMNGNNCNTDSYISTNGPYDKVLNRYANGNVASVNGVVDVGVATVRGYVMTGPTGRCAVKSGGLVGDFSWTGNQGQQIQDGHCLNNFNMDLPDAALPPYNWLGPPSVNTMRTKSFC